MKSSLLLLLLLLAAAAGWGEGIDNGEGYAVVIHNPEKVSLYFELDPPELAGFDPAASVFSDVIYDYFGRSPAEGEGGAGFEELPPAATKRLSGLSQGAHLLLVFFIVPGEPDFPVRALSLQAGGALAERSYQIYREPSLVRVRPGRGRLEEFEPVAAVPERPAAPAPARAGGATAEAAPAVSGPAAPAPALGTPGYFRFSIDNRYDDWEAIPTLLSFGADFRPLTFGRERYGRSQEVLPLTQSLCWRKAGTALGEVRAVSDPRAVYLYVATTTGIADGLSIYLYLRPGTVAAAQGQANRFTVELVPARGTEPGLVVLWEKGRKPQIVGELASNSFFMEARIDKARLGRLLLSDPEIGFCDLTTSFFDRTAMTYEEFYYRSLSLAEIPTLETLY
jgi:hypothetical protein